MLDFLSENYIWFFVAAVVLLFALIGFIVEGKKKKSKEFKGESVNDNVENLNSASGLEVNDIPVAETINNISSGPTAPVENITEPQAIEESNQMETLQNVDVTAQTNFSANEPQSVTIGEPIEMQSEPVIPTAPESFYDEPLMPDNSEEKPTDIEINPNENNNTERQ